MAKKTVAAVAAVLLLLLGSAWISGRGDGDRDLAPAGGVPPAGHDVTRTAAAPAPQEATAPSAPAIATESPPPASKSPGKAASGSVLVTARWPDGSPAEGIGVVLRLESDREDPRSARVARSGVDGTVLFEDLPPGTAWVRADRDSNGGSRVAIAGGTRPVPFALTLAEGMTVDGVVVDPDNRPVPGATLWLGAGGPLVSGTPAAESGADGKFRLRGVVSPCEIGARAAGYAPSLRALPQGAPGSTQFLVLTLRGPGASVSGRVIDPRGEVVAGALVKVGADGNELELGPQGVEGAQVLGLVVTTDEAGRFRTEGIRPGSVPVRAVVPGFAPWRGEVRVEPQGSADMEIRLGRGATLEGRVLDGEGNPVGKATVSVTDVTGGFHTWALTGSDGAYRIPDVPAGEWLVEAMRIHVGKMRTRMRFEGGKSVTWEPRLSTGRILEGRLVDATGTPLAGWSVTATTEVVAGTVEEYYAMGGSTGTDGRFRFESLPERAMRLLVVAPATDRRVRAPALDLRNLAAGEEPLEIRVPADRLPTSFIEARLAGSDGRVPHDWNVGVDWGAGSTGVAFPDPATGRLKIGPLPPGEYSVHLWSQGRKPLPVRKFRLETGRTEDLGEIVVDPIR